MKRVIVLTAAVVLVGCHRAKAPIDPEAQKSEMCNILIGQVVDGQKVLEINNVKVLGYSSRAEENEVVTCSGDAITVYGEKRIEFGLVRSPQGKPLVSTRFE